MLDTLADGIGEKLFHFAQRKILGDKIEIKINAKHS